MWIKICGFTNPTNAKAALVTQPDAIGLNFYPSSKRYVTPEIARRIAAEVPAEIERVGVFVNSDAAEIQAIVNEVQLTTVQLHGDESVEQVAAIHRLCPQQKIIRAVRVGPEGMEPVNQQIREILRADVPLQAVLVDALVTGSYGGTGHAIHPVWLQDYDPALPPLILAGGLKPDNVATAIQASRPAGVDTASGVESAPGLKDPQRVQQFIQAARSVKF